jgi:leishmanolysin-like peptidase
MYENTCVNNIVIPKDYVTIGAEQSDFILMVTMRPTRSKALAWATSCGSDQYNRPIIGVINFCPNKVSLLEADKTALIAVATHEIIHALGFSEASFDHYTRHDGTPYKEIVRKGVKLHDSAVNILVTPEVVKSVSAQLDCHPKSDDPNFNNVGAILEDAGGPMTGGAHFEKLQFMYELMTGSIGASVVYSTVHLAALHDSGWYLVDYQDSSPLTWGFNTGCDFIFNKCTNWINDAKTCGFYCDVNKQPNLDGCGGDDFTSIARCGTIDSLVGPGCNQMAPYT